MSARRVASLMVLTVVLAAGALVLDWYEKNKESPELVGRTLLGSVAVERAGLVLIETPQGQVTLRRTAWGWVVDEQHAFAADVDKLRTLLLRLGQVRITQRVHVRRPQLAELGLLQKVENDWQFEAGRTASVLTLVHGLEYRHKLMYQLLVGKRRSGSGTYVRFPGDSTAYLVAADLRLEGDSAAWIRRRVFAADAAAAMRRVRIRAGEGAPLTLTRAHAKAPWRLAGSDTAVDEARVRALVETLAGLRLHGVEPAADGTPPALHPAAAVEVGFADRRTVTLRLAAAGPRADTRRALLSATLRDADAAGATAAATSPPQPGSPRWRVESFNRHFAGRPVHLDAAQSRTLLAAPIADGPAH